VNMKTGEPVRSSRRAGSSSRQGVAGCQETQEEEEGSEKTSNQGSFLRESEFYCLTLIILVNVF
jgi:hypothetical protein